VLVLFVGMRCSRLSIMVLYSEARRVFSTDLFFERLFLCLSLFYFIYRIFFLSL
jgi:hypothetical protein